MDIVRQYGPLQPEGRRKLFSAILARGDHSIEVIVCGRKNAAATDGSSTLALL
jgi:hypothetical protein